MSKKSWKFRSFTGSLPTSSQPRQRQRKRALSWIPCFSQARGIQIGTYSPLSDNTEYDFLIDEEYDEDIDCIVVKKAPITSEALSIKPAVSILSKTQEVLISNLCFMGEEEQVSNSKSHLLGSNASLSLPTGLCVLDSTQNIQPVLTESLLDTLNDVPYINESAHNIPLSGATPLCTGTTYPEIPVHSFSSTLEANIHGMSPYVPHLLHINEFVNCQDFCLLHYLKPLLFPPGNSIPVLPYSLANPLKDPVHNEDYTYCMKRPTNMDEFTDRVAVAAAICEERKSLQNDLPDMTPILCSQLGPFYNVSLYPYTEQFPMITAYNEYSYFVKEKCFGDADLGKEGYELVKKKMEEKIPRLFELNNGKKPPHIIPLLVEGVSSSINEEIIELFKDNSQSMEWKQFTFLVFLKAYSLKHRVHAISMTLFFHFASSFNLTDETNMLSSFQKQQLLFKFESETSHPAVIIDLQWFFQCLENLKILAQENGLIKNGEIAMNSKVLEKVLKMSSTTSLPSHWLIDILKQHHLCSVSSTDNLCYMPLLLPSACEYSTGPTTSNKISPIYLRCLAGPVPPGKFEALTVLLRNIPELTLIQSQSRCVVTYKLDNHNNQYYLKISNHHGFIKVFFSSLTSGEISVSYKDACNITSYIVKNIQEAISCIFAQTKAPKELVMYMECQDQQCHHINPERVHLAKVCIEEQYNECTLSRPQNVRFTDLDRSQTVWIHQFIKGKRDSKDSVRFKASSRPISTISADLQMSVYPELLKRQCSDQLVTQYIKRHRHLLIQHDNLVCSAIPWGNLFGSGYLDSLEDIHQNLKEKKPNEAINVILESVQKTGIPGVMAFLCSIKNSAESDDPCPTLQSLYTQITSSDEDYKLIKNIYLESVIVKSMSM